MSEYDLLVNMLSFPFYNFKENEGAIGLQILLMKQLEQFLVYRDIILQPW